MHADRRALPFRCEVNLSKMDNGRLQVTSECQSAIPLKRVLTAGRRFWCDHPVPPFRVTAGKLSASFVVLLLPLLFYGCSVLFVSPYDEMTDRAANELTTRTEIFLVQYAARTDETGKVMKSGKSYDREAAAFYNEARGAVAAMLLRSEQEEKNDEEVQILRDLSRQYDRLEASHRLGTITMNSAAGLHRTLRALLHVQLTKKHLATSKEPTTTPATP
jgi:hypothetical protein